MKIIFLGTNGWYDTDTGNTICTLINMKDSSIILDAGNGIYKADRYIKKDKPIHLFLSHFHIDHTEGLHTLAKFNFQSLTIYGQPGTRKAVDTLLDQKFSVPRKRLPFKCDVVELARGWHKEPFRMQCLPLKHSSHCYGYRFEIEDKVISYCTDTGPCKEAVELSGGADLIISECSFTSGQENPEWPHMNPELAAKLAADSKAKRLVLTHFDANVYKTLKMRDAAEKHAKKVFKNAIAAKDGFMATI